MLALALVLIDVIIIWLAGAGGLLLLITTLTGITLLVSAWCARERPPGTQLEFGGAAALWLGEMAAAWSLFLFWMPLERWLMPRNCAARGVDAGGSAANHVPPVLLIHGYVNNAGAMWKLWRALCHKGLGVYTLNLEPVYGDIDPYAPLIAARIGAIRALTGAQHVTLVCHSMGGLAARAYLRHCALMHIGPGVAKVITLGTPHHGTQLARLEWSRNGKQMRPDSAWLAALAAHERDAWSCPLVSIYSLDDNVVVPHSSARLNGARNIEIAGVGHMSLPLSRRVIDLVLAEISGTPVA